MTDPQKVLDAVWAEYGMTRAEFAPGGKGGDVTAAREICCHLVTRGVMDDTRLAALLGVHRTAVLKLRRSCATRLKKDRAFAQRVKRIRNAAGLTKKKTPARS